MSEDHKQFKDALDGHHQWPCLYVFKFIVPSENLQLFEACFPEHQLEKRESKTGKYTSITMELNMCSSKEVMDIYEKAAQVPGVMAL